MRIGPIHIPQEFVLDQYTIPGNVYLAKYTFPRSVYWPTHSPRECVLAPYRLPGHVCPGNQVPEKLSLHSPGMNSSPGTPQYAQLLGVGCHSQPNLVSSPLQTREYRNSTRQILVTCQLWAEEFGLGQPKQRKA